MPEEAARLIQAIQSALSPDLLKPYWRSLLSPGDHPVTGHCYIAAEALWHLYGKHHGFVPQVMRISEGTHWFLKGADGQILDPSKEQYVEPPDYAQARGSGFLTKRPSRRAQKVMRRIRQRKATQV